jgi:signal transduction histidine kinase
MSMVMNLHWELLAIAALVLAALAMPVCALVMQPQRLNEPLDRVFLRQPMAWILVAAALWLELTAASAPGNLFWSTLTYHIVCATTLGFLLASAHLSDTLTNKWIALYALGGAALLYMGTDTLQPNAVVRGSILNAWMVLTFATVTLALIALLFELYNDRNVPTALAVIAAWWGWSLVLGDLGSYAVAKMQGLTPAPIVLSAPHVLFGAHLVTLWLLLTGRVKWMVLHKEIAHTESTGFAPLSEFRTSGSSSQGYSHELAMAAVADERKRIAQDIHDGVGSQLVGLIAGLDASSPLHRRIMLGLENCLLDLKTTVDNVDNNADSDTNIFDALGRLRYRFQPSLSRAGIRMLWKVDAAGPLIAVRASQLAHIVRIAQESLANVLLHSEAKAVQVKCRYEAEPVPRMLLEIFDNGIGIAKRSSDEMTGKGLSGMKERAKSIGAELQIGTKLGVGTRVRLYLPLR